MVTWAVCWLARLTIRHWTAATKVNGLRSTLQPLPLLPILLGGCSTVGRVEGREQDRLYFRAPGVRARIEPRIKWSSCRGAVEMNRPFSKLKFDHWQLDGGSELEVRCGDDSHQGRKAAKVTISHPTLLRSSSQSFLEMYILAGDYISVSKGCYISSCSSDFTHLYLNRRYLLYPDFLKYMYISAGSRKIYLWTITH